MAKSSRSRFLSACVPAPGGASTAAVDHVNLNVQDTPISTADASAGWSSMKAPERVYVAADTCLGDAAVLCAFQVSDTCSGQQDTRQLEAQDRLLIEEDAEKCKIPPQDGAFSPKKILVPIESLGGMCQFLHMIDAGLGRSCDRILQMPTPKLRILAFYGFTFITLICFVVYELHRSCRVEYAY